MGPSAEQAGDRRRASPGLAFDRARAGLACWILIALAAPTAAAQTTSPADVAATVDRLAKRLEDLERSNAALADQNRALVDRVDELNRRLKQVQPATQPAATALDPLPTDATSPTSSPTPSAALPSIEMPDGIDADAGTALPAPERFRSGSSRIDEARRFLVGEYDEELGTFVLVRPRDAKRVPFELRFDVFTQARYTNFANSRNTWVDAEGVVRPVQAFSSVEISRNFLVFSGFALDPRLQYNAMIFSSTPINDTVYLGWINYRFNRAFDLRVGNWLIPGTREWYESFRWTLGADRLMATTFFRPNISPGVWLQGEPVDGVNYVAMIANSLNRFSQGIATQVGRSLAFGGTAWWEPTDDYGVGVSDVEYHEDRSFRLGTSLNVAEVANQGFTLAAVRNPEDTLIRLSDGTPLFRPGVLAPGVELQSTNLQLWTVDAAMKHRGLGISGEYFFRWLDQFKVVGGRSPYDGFFDHGGLLQAGYFLHPHKLEAFARTSYVTGHFGGGVEYGGGLNWYPRGARTWRMTLEALRIENSPAQNFITGYRAGETGTLFQAQWFTDF